MNLSRAPARHRNPQVTALGAQDHPQKKTATISLHGNRYEVDAALVGRRVEAVFDPFDLTTVEVRYLGRPMGTAVPHRIGRHVHPDARPDLPTPPAPPTGIDYLALVAAQHRAQLAARINYTDLPTTTTPTAASPGEPDGHGEREDGLDDAALGDDAGLEAELASFAALRRQLADRELPGQLDLTDLTDQLDQQTDTDEHTDTDTDSDRTWQR